MPLSAWFSSTPNDAGHYPVTFGLHSGYSDRPVELPCGKCVGCVQDRCEDWSVRCYHESTLHAFNCFATLTYADPSPDRISKPDLQHFFKRLRKRGFKLRYFAVGEYGGQTRRPHYHVIFFGEDFREGGIRVAMGGKSETEYYVSPTLSDAWGQGHCLVAPADPAAIFYTCGYSLKSLGNGETFALQSRRLALGTGWLDRFHDDVSRNNFVTIDGARHRVPAAYLARPERALDFDHLKDARRAYGANLDATIRWARRLAQRPHETNMRAGAAAARGSL